MRANGISYDTGFVRDGRTSREDWDPEVVRRELRIIRDDLGCNAVRVMGGDPERLELAAGYAAELGLEEGKPVAITEFGAATFRGAGDRGARGLEIVEHDKDTGAPLRLDGVYARDEEGQASYLRELLDVFEAEGVDSGHDLGAQGRLPDAGGARPVTLRCGGPGRRPGSGRARRGRRTAWPPARPGWPRRPWRRWP
jgi:hypothetical protein